MEGVEDVPEVVMRRGLPWSWETFPEYLDVVGSRPHDINVAAQLPHSPLRVYVMGERGLRGEPATEADLQKMTALATEAMQAGALGFGTSRSIFHRSSDGTQIPSKDVGEAELHAIANGIAAAGHGVLQALFDPVNLETDFALLRRVAEQSGRPLSFTLVQIGDFPNRWTRTLQLVEEANRDGVLVKAQVIGRPTGILIGLNLSYNPFSLYPSYAAIAALPLEEKVAKLRDPELRRRLLSEVPGGSEYPTLRFLSAYPIMFPIEEPINYEPPPSSSVAARAGRLGIRPEELVYDMLLERAGNAVLFVPLANYADGNLDAVLAMLKHPDTLLGLGDGGAHYGLICDAGYPTYMLTYWARDRAHGERLPLSHVVKTLTRDPALAIGLADRGLIARGHKADLNIIDFDKLRLHVPGIAFDLPGGGRRLTQAADGYIATIVNGVVIHRDGMPTGALPGRLVRGPQPSPATLAA
jgi:N-acyl-D-aspartate/D-glutamate deacylase